MLQSGTKMLYVSLIGYELHQKLNKSLVMYLHISCFIYLIQYPAPYPAIRLYRSIGTSRDKAKGVRRQFLGVESLVASDVPKSPRLIGFWL